MQSSRFLHVLLAALSVAFATAARADTVYLRDGQAPLKGRVIERADGRIEIETKHGARIVDKADVIRIEPDDSGKTAGPTIDTLYVVDGRVLTGNVTTSDDGKEIIISNDKGGESRFPREMVKAILFRKGKTPPPAPAGAEAAPVTTQEDAEKHWRDQIEANLAKLRDPLSDAKEKKKARDEILELGVFAVNYVKAAIAAVASNDPIVRPVLEEVLEVAAFKAVVPAKLEQAMPGICERLIDKDADARIKVVNEVALTCPDDCAQLLLYLVTTDKEPKVKSICVGQLSMLKRYDELAQVLKMHEHGPWRLVAAFELGEAGIYIGVPVLIEALKLDGDAFKDVRALAIEKLKAWTHQGNLGYLAESEDKAERDAAVARWESWWQTQGQEWAEKNAKYENGQVPDEDRAKALDRWRDGNKALADLAKKQEAAQAAGTPLDAREVSYAYETAAFLFKQAYDLDPTLCSARLSRAIILYEQLGRPREAEGELKLVLLRFAPENAKYLRSLATLHLAKIAELDQNWKRAESFWADMRSLDPDSLDAYIGIGDSYLERALATPSRGDRGAGSPPALAPDSVKPASEPKEEGRPNPPSLDQIEERDQNLLRAIQAYKDALNLVDKKQRELRDSVTELGPLTGEVEDHQTGRFLSRVREDRDTLVKRAAGVWFRLGRAESARPSKPGDTHAKDALAAFKAARSLDPKDERYVQAAALWEKLAAASEPAPDAPAREKP